jgi:hypothetical protein
LVERYLAKVQVDGSNPLARSNIFSLGPSTPVDDALSWDGNWAWALPLIVLTLIVHVVGLGVINTRLLRTTSRIRPEGNFFVIYVVVMAVAALLVAVLHAFEATIWAAAYRVLGALPDGRTALLYSLSAITTYGHTDLYLAPHWRLMGAFEALNGVLLFGLTTAFLYGHLQRVLPLERHVCPPLHSPDAVDPRL